MALTRKTTRAGVRSLVATDSEQFPRPHNAAEWDQFFRDLYWLDNGFDPVDVRLGFTQLASTAEN